MSKTIRIGTRDSELALWQAHTVQKKLNDLGYQTEIIAVKSQGDIILDKPLYELGITGIFTKTLDIAMLNGQVDIAVHSMKDVPMHLPEGLTLAVICEREDPLDAFVSNHYMHFDELPLGAKVGTSSLRRKCQILQLRPDIEIVDLRGNVGTRLSKLDDGLYHAIILASAGLKRLGLADRIRHCLAPIMSLPAVGQGALGLECRSDDAELLKLIAPLQHEETSICVRAERAFNAYLEGGCQVPIAGYATLLNDDQLQIEGRVGSVDGQTLLKEQLVGEIANAEQLGEQLAQRLLAQGAGELLKALH